MPRNPWEIPEVFGAVAAYFSKNDLARCLRVSKSWRDSLLPFLWRAIKVKFYPPTGPSLEDINCHRHLIRDLTFNGYFLGFDSKTCKLGFYPERSMPHIRRKLLELTMMFPSLCELNLTRVELVHTPWMTLSEHTRIRKLHLDDIHIKETEAPAFWKTCEKLDVLSLTKVTIKGGRIPSDIVFHQLHKLVLRHTVGLNTAAQFDLIYRCPSLKDVTWGTDISISPVHHTWLIQPIPDEHWPRLDSLTLSHDFQDTDLAHILNGVGHTIHYLDLEGCMLGPQASRILASHFNTLATVILQLCNVVTNSTIQDILCNCSRLVDLRVGDVSAKDIDDCGPWVCQQLRRLTICIRVGMLEQHLQPLIFGRLATLVQLEYLAISQPSSHSDHGVLEFRLECGLGQLSSLERLKTLVFLTFRHGACAPEMGMDEVVWMVDNWKQLRKVAGPINSSQQSDRQLKKTLQLHGIGS